LSHETVTEDGVPVNIRDQRISKEASILASVMVCVHESGGLASPCLLERGVPRSALNEIVYGPVEVTERLLEGDAPDLGEPSCLWLFLEHCEQRREVVVGQVLAPLLVGFGTLLEAPVVDIADTTEGVGQQGGQVRGRIEPASVRALAPHDAKDTLFDERVSMVGTAFHPPIPWQGSSYVITIDS